ncbi:MAG: putative motility protein [Sporomusa sp.]|nr:putative motility protein [Sporomusa sp.]
MDIAAFSTIASQAGACNQAGILVMKKAMDTSASQSQGLVDLLQTAAPRISPSHLGNTIDLSA